MTLVDGDIGQAATAEKVAQTAIAKFGSIDYVVNNAGIFIAKPFTDYTAEDFRALASTNLEGFIFITQLAVKQILSQGASIQVYPAFAVLVVAKRFQRYALFTARVSQEFGSPN